MTHPRVAPAEADRLVREEGYLFLDVRSVPEFGAGHPAGAYNVPLAEPDGAGRMQPNPEFVAVVSAAFDKDQPLVVGCRSGSRSERAARALLDAGFERIVEQRAGWGGTRDAFGRATEPGWHAAGLACATRALAGRDYAALRHRSR